MQRPKAYINVISSACRVISVPWRFMRHRFRIGSLHAASGQSLGTFVRPQFLLLIPIFTAVIDDNGGNTVTQQ